MEKTIAILGSTGSIGTQTLEVVRENQDIRVAGLSAGSNITLLEKQISDRLADLLEEKNSILITDSSNACYITNDDRHSDSYRSQVVVPIVSQGDLIGSIILVSTDGIMGDTELKTAEVGAAFIAKQMELN